MSNISIRAPGKLTLFGSRRPLENFLLSQFVPSVYADDSRLAVAGQFRCTAQQAERWLGHLAWDIYQQYRSNQQVYESEQEGKEDRGRADMGGAPVLAWWEMSSLAGRWRRLGIALRAAVLSSVAIVLGIWVLKQHGDWRDGAYSGSVNYGDLLLGGRVGRFIRPTVQVLVRAAHEGFDKGGTGEFFRVLGDVFSGIFSHPFLIVIFVALLVGIATVATSLGAFRAPARLEIQAGDVLVALVECCSLFGGAALTAFLLLNAAHWPVRASVFFSSRSTWLTLLAVSLLGLISLPSLFVSRSDAYGNLGPDESLRLDRQTDAIVTVSGRSAFTVAVWLFCGPQIAAAYAVYAVTATIIALILGGQNDFASRSYTDARNWLAAGGRIPWHTMAFLADASRRGVLRQVGAAYQFRHVRLLEQVRYWRSADGRGRPGAFKTRRSELADQVRELFDERRDETLAGFKQDAKRCRQAAEAAFEVPPVELAEALDDLAGRLRQWPDVRVRPVLRDVLVTYRILVETDEAAFTPRLAKVLRDSARAFRPADALSMSNRAVGCYRNLAQTDPATFLPALAEAVSDLVGWLRQRPEKRVLAALRNTLNTCRTLAEPDPAFRPGLARVLKVSVGVFSWDEALRVSEDAVDCYRDLAQTDPAAFLPALAEAVSDLARRLIRLGRQGEALTLTGEIADAARDLAAANSLEFCLSSPSHSATWATGSGSLHHGEKSRLAPGEKPLPSIANWPGRIRTGSAAGSRRPWTPWYPASRR